MRLDSTVYRQAGNVCDKDRCRISKQIDVSGKERTELSTPEPNVCFWPEHAVSSTYLQQRETNDNYEIVAI